MASEVLERKDHKMEDTWDIASLFSSLDDWEKEYKKVGILADKFTDHQGRLTQSHENLLKALRDRDELFRAMENVYVYTHLLLDQDTRNSESQSLADRSMNLYIKVGEKSSFLVPEILSIDEKLLGEFLSENQELKEYQQALEDIMREKAHTLSAREESIVAQMGEVAASPGKIFSMLNDADLKFPTIIGEDNKEVEISHGNFIPLMESKDRSVRERTFKALYGVYKSFENTFAASLNGNLKANIFNSKLRNYGSSREASLSSNNVDLSVYDKLLESVHENLDSMYKYMNIRKRVLKLDELHMYDLYTPIVQDYDYRIKYEESVKLIKEALKPLGEEYYSAMEDGFNSRWIDVYENRGKRSGAYSSGSYDSKPFILLNYHDTLDNLFTVAHEMGHSMHSYFTRLHQPYVYGNYSIFVAEVASTVNEILLLDYMIKNAKDKNEKLYLINHYLESFRTTVFRQSMFAEFEKLIYQHLEMGGALTAEFLNESYKELNLLYYGSDIVVDDEIAIEWARIPHFYYNFYVYQYATGFSAAVDFSQKILENNNGDVEKYINFLKSGSSDYPINVLKKAGLDMTTPEPVNNAMKRFRELVDEFDKLI